MQQEIGVTEARTRFAELVDQVRYRGDTIVLMKSGKPAAALVPLEVLRQLGAVSLLVTDGNRLETGNEQ